MKYHKKPGQGHLDAYLNSIRDLKYWLWYKFSKDYVTYYRKVMKEKLKRHPYAISDWEEGGKKQLEFLKEHGLKPYHTLFEIGCGTLRAGKEFIRYLDSFNYMGIDISAEIIDKAKEVIFEDIMLFEKCPDLAGNNNLKFAHHSRCRDYILAFSVFNHLPKELVEECFANIGKIMHKGSLFFCNYNEGEYRNIMGKEWIHPFEFFMLMAHKYNFRISKVKNFHPTKTMLKVRKRE